MIWAKPIEKSDSTLRKTITKTKVILQVQMIIIKGEFSEIDTDMAQSDFLNLK